MNDKRELDVASEGFEDGADELLRVIQSTQGPKSAFQGQNASRSGRRGTRLISR
jgi:hypothetical protein